MNIAAFVISLFAGLISFLQGGCATGVSAIGTGLGSRVGGYDGAKIAREGASMGGAGALIVLAALLAIIGGSFALPRKKASYWLLSISSGMCLLAVMVSGGIYKDAYVWLTAYAIAGGCAYAACQDNQSESISNSSSESMRTIFLSETRRPQEHPVSSSTKTYEPIIGLETESLLKRAFLFLEDGEFDDAGRYLEQALNQDAEDARVHFGLLMLGHKVHNVDELIGKLTTPLEEEKLFQRALRFAQGEYKSQLESYAQASHDKLEQERIAAEAIAEQKRLAAEAERERQRAEREAENERRYQEILALREKAVSLNELDELLPIIFRLRPYKDTEQIYNEVQTEKKYQNARRELQNASGIINLQNAISQLEELDDYKDSEKLLDEAQSKLEALEALARKRNKILLAASVLVVTSFFGWQWYQYNQMSTPKPHEPSRQEVTPHQEDTSTRLAMTREWYEWGCEFLDSKNYPDALKYFRLAANENYAPAQDKLAWMYQNGWGVTQDYSQAVSWFRKAAEQGNTEALASMGLMYLKGWGVPQNYDTALEWYGKAANQGSEVAVRRINSIQLLKQNRQKIASIERNEDYPVHWTIFAETLSVRQAPNTKSKRIKTLKTGHPVSVSRAVDSDNDYWFYVKTVSGTEGWVLGGYVNLIDRDLSYQETTNKKHSLPASGYVTTHEDTLNLRNIPTIKGSSVVKKLDSGTYFTTYEIFAGNTIDWYRIRTTEGDEGWVSGRFINLR